VIDEIRKWYTDQTGLAHGLAGNRILKIYDYLKKRNLTLDQIKLSVTTSERWAYGPASKERIGSRNDGGSTFYFYIHE